MPYMIWYFLTIVGAWLGWSVSMDWSNNPLFPYGSTAFVAFWTLFGTVIGWVAGMKIYRWLEQL